MAFIYDLEIVLRFFYFGDSKNLDGQRMKALFPTLRTAVGNRKRTRRAADGSVVRNFDEIGGFSSLEPKCISGDVPQMVLRQIFPVIFSKLNTDIGKCAPRTVCIKNLCLLFQS